MARFPVFSHNKGNRIKLFYDPKKVYPQRHDASSFYPLLVSFHFQIAYRKLRNLRIDINKLIGKVSINLLHHTKFITSCKVIHFCNHYNYCTCWFSCQSCTPKQIDLTSVFVIGASTKSFSSWKS